MQEKFSTGYMALEILCNMFVQNAKRHNEIIEIRAIKETEVKLKELVNDLEFKLETAILVRLQIKLLIKNPV